jgi:hypothetical protein
VARPRDVRFLMSHAGHGITPGCAEPQRCQWQLAEQTAAGRQIIARGVGAYRLGAQAAGCWLSTTGTFPVAP